MAVRGKPTGATSNTPGSIVTQGLAVAAIWGLLLWRHGWTDTTIVAVAFTATAVPLAVIDAQTRRLPNVLVVVSSALVAGAAVGVTLATGSTTSLLLPGLGGATVLTAFHLVLYYTFAGQFGGGDVKLASPLGFTLSWYGWATLVTGVLLGWLLAATWVVARRCVPRLRQSLDLPLAPFLVAGALVSLLL